jgi:hypothetical protein
MTEKHFFADVDLPFHVWVRIGRRWVLRDAAAHLQQRATGYRQGKGAGAPRQGEGPKTPAQVP